MYGALIPISLVALLSMLLHEAALYFGNVFAGQTPNSFGTGTADVIGSYFSGQFAFFDATLFANPMFLLRAILTVGCSLWLVVRLLRHRIGMPEFIVFFSQRATPRHKSIA